MLLLTPDQMPASVSINDFFGNRGTVVYGQLAAFSVIYSTPVILLYVLVARRLGGGSRWAARSRVRPGLPLPAEAKAEAYSSHSSTPTVCPARLSGQLESQPEIEALRAGLTGMPGDRETGAAAAPDLGGHGLDREAAVPLPCSPAAMFRRHSPERRSVPDSPPSQLMSKKAIRNPTVRSPSTMRRGQATPGYT